MKNDGFLYEPLESKTKRKEQNIWRRIFRISCIVIVFWLGIYLVSYSSRSSRNEAKKQSTALHYVTIDGYDESSAVTKEEIKLWKEWNNPSSRISATIKHGEKVQLIDEKGNEVLVETSDGRRGWVKKDFIADLK